MQDITAWKIKSRRNLCSSRRFVMSLLCHQLITSQTQLDTADAVNDVIYARVARHEMTDEVREEYMKRYSWRDGAEKIYRVAVEEG